MPASCAGLHRRRPAAIQDAYPEAYSHCYGCGRLNELGMQIKSYWDSRTSTAVCVYTPAAHHIAVPGFVYGGLIASLIDCHCIGTAFAIASDAAPSVFEGAASDAPRFVTASLHVDYLRPTPLGVPLELRAHPTEIGERKVVVAATLSANGEVCARGEVVAVRLPESMR
jgi:acyl-coenzyme A thioesterase PaaI-like protein